MLTREDLRKLRFYDHVIETANERRADIRAMARGLSRPFGEGGRTHARRDKMAEYMVRIEKADENMAVMVAELTELENRVRAEIVKLPEQMAEVMHARYLEFNYRYQRRLSWKEVARRTRYSEQHCKRIHAAALEWLKRE